jgi:hypothetical protein
VNQCTFCLGQAPVRPCVRVPTGADHTMNGTVVPCIKLTLPRRIMHASMSIALIQEHLLRRAIG